jgi:hypothetical protein
MAEFLVYNQEHWMDLPSKERPDLTGFENVKRKIQENKEGFTPEQVAKKLKLLNDKYNQRYKKGDVVEVKEDGFWRKRKGFGSEHFALIHVPGLSGIEALKYQEPDQEVSKNPHRVKYHKRRYTFDMNKIPLNRKKKATVRKLDQTILRDKSKKR